MSVFLKKSDQYLYKHLSCSTRRGTFPDRPNHHVGLPELPLHRAAGKSSQRVYLLLIPHWPHPSKTSLLLKRSQTTVNYAICITHTILRKHELYLLSFFEKILHQQSSSSSHLLYHVFFQKMMGCCLRISFFVGTLKD